MRIRQAVFCLVVLFAPLVKANVVGTDAQNFNAISSGLDFVTVHSSETLEPGYVNLGFFMNLAVNSLPIFQQTDGSRTQFEDELLGADLNIGYGLKENWDVGLSFPQIWYQHVGNDSVYRGFYENKGNTEIRVNTKYRLSGDSFGGTAVIASANFNRIQDNPYTGEGAGPTYNLEFAVDRMYRGVAVGANLGYRLRDPGTANPNVPIEPFKDQIIGSMAASYYLPNLDAKMILEVFGSYPAQKSDKADFRSQSSLEALLGIKYDLTRQFAFHFGGGTQILQGTGSPDWRVYTGVNYAFGPINKKMDSPVAKKFEEQDRVVLDINFDFDSDKINDETSLNVLRELADYLLVIGKYHLVISGHTDSVGSEAYNQGLSVRRAASVKNFLIKNYPKITTDKITDYGFGESQPVADNGNYQGRQKNRRVEFKIEKQK
ncbi:MAG: OmpA family protein [Pseudomonadota bacterium]|nr:OmpA family protein [Pseudomonadota bacterium]